MFVVNNNQQANVEQTATGAENSAAELLKNIKSLFLVKLKNARMGFYVFLVIVALLMITSLVTTARSILSPSNSYTPMVSVSTTMDFSTPFFLAIVFGFIAGAAQYRQANNKLAVFPQTNNSRWLSSQLINYTLAVGIGLTLLALYLANYAFVGVVSIFKEGVHLGFKFDILFCAAGLVTFLAYSFLSIAFIELVAALIRKWPYISGIVITIVASLVLSNLTAFFDQLPKALAFLIDEASFGLFLLKAIGLWVAMVALAYVINRHTVYFKSKGSGSKRRKTIFVLVCVCVGGISAIGLSVYRERTGFDAQPAPEPGINMPQPAVTEPDAVYIDGAWRDFLEKELERLVEVRFDVSHLPKGSEIKIADNNDFLVYDAGRSLIFHDYDEPIPQRNLREWVNPLTDIQGDTLVVYLSPPYMELHGVEILGYLNARYSVELIGDTLHFSYEADDDVNVVFIPMWRQLIQFDFAQKSGRYSGGTMYVNLDATSGWFDDLGGGSGSYGGGMYAYTAVE